MRTVCLLFFLLLAGLYPSIVSASMPVRVVIIGCVQDGLLVTESTDFGTHVGMGTYRIRPRLLQGEDLDLSEFEGRRISLSGNLLPGDMFYVKESSIRDSEPCLPLYETNDAAEKTAF